MKGLAMSVNIWNGGFSTEFTVCKIRPRQLYEISSSAILACQYLALMLCLLVLRLTVSVSGVTL